MTHLVVPLSKAFCCGSIVLGLKLKLEYGHHHLSAQNSLLEAICVESNEVDKTGMAHIMNVMRRTELCIVPLYRSSGRFPTTLLRTAIVTSIAAALAATSIF
jgi:hypothetical protein